jgi:hypothetical protein
MPRVSADHIRKLIQDALSHRKFSGVELIDLEFDYLSGTYKAMFIAESGDMKEVIFLEEWFDDEDPDYPAKKIKRALKKNLLRNPDEEDQP